MMTFGDIVVLTIVVVKFLNISLILPWLYLVMLIYLFFGNVTGIGRIGLI
jgi:hypothetical protein